MASTFSSLPHFQGFAATAPWELFWTERLCGAEPPESLKGTVRLVGELVQHGRCTEADAATTP
jgi:hypothetical protein